MRRTPTRRPRALVVLALLLPACASIVDLEPPRIGEVQRLPPEQSYVYDAAGNQLAVLRQEFRERVPYERLPQVLIDAVVAAEDRRFWVHDGVDARAIARAALANLAEGEVEQGGSTITQQLVKNLYLPPDAPRDFATKAREALLARDLERELTKEEILEEYLNTVYFGNGAYGVQAAAYTYWREDVSQVALHEAAVLAALIRSPGALDLSAAASDGQAQDTPDTTAVRARRDAILQAMREQGLAGDADVGGALAQPVTVEPRPTRPLTHQPYWVDYIERTLLADPAFGPDRASRAQRLYGGGLRIHTTLDPAVQAQAEEAAHRYFPDPTDPEVALVAVDPQTGHVLAAVGGRDYRLRQFDLATQGRRQPGSTFKTFVLTAAVADGWRPESIVNGDQGVLRYGDGGGASFEVVNYDRVSYGNVTLAEATRNSVNGAYARLILDVGVARTIAVAHALGVTSPLNDDPAIALGGLTVGVTPLEMAAAYATLANLGEQAAVSPIDRVEDARGDVVWRPDRTPRLVVDPGVAWVVTQLLRQVVEDGTGVRARLAGREAAGKTGTTTNHYDAWFVGYTPELVASVWMGYPDANVPLRRVGGESVVTGGSWPARIWREFMTDALADTAPSTFALPPEHLVTVEVDPASGLRAAPWCPGEPRTMPRILAPRATCPSPPPPPPTPATPAPGPTGTASPDSPAPTPPPADGPPSPTSSPTPRPGPGSPTPGAPPAEPGQG